MSNILLNINSVKKSFAGKTLFKDVSFGINDKDRIGLVGPNGAGKSTLLKILMQQMDADQGQVVRKKGLQIGFLGQSPSFKSKATILEALQDFPGGEHGDHIAKAYEWMSKLDLFAFGEDFLVEKLSGGWQKRVALARELLQEPDLLLLDEPTNHLDIRSILWLEEFLQNSNFAFLVVTHDRLFLQRVTERILDLDPKNPNNLLDITGGYMKYLESKDQLLEAQRSQEQKLRNTLRRETEWLRRGAKARQTKQKARILAAQDLSENVTEISEKNRQRSVQIQFGAGGHSPKKLIELKNVSKSFAEKKLFDGIDLLISPNSRVALLGDNGCGKSTLIKIMMDQEQPDTGSVFIAEKIKISVFEQNRETLNHTQSVLKNISPHGDYVDFRGQYVHARSYLEKFLFYGQHVDLPVSKLSGGEQARLRLAQLMLQESQVLILDEPTNDLDVETLDILEDSIKTFPGAVILVTHDRFFMDSVAEKILAFPDAESSDKKLLTFADYFQWEQWSSLRGNEAIQDNRQSIPGPRSIDEVGKTTSQSLRSNSKKLSFKEQFEWENIEQEIHQLEIRISDLKKDLERPENATEALRLNEISNQLYDLQHQLEHKFQRWAELENKLKN